MKIPGTMKRYTIKLGDLAVPVPKKWYSQHQSYLDLIMSLCLMELYCQTSFGNLVSSNLFRYTVHLSFTQCILMLNIFYSLLRQRPYYKLSFAIFSDTFPCLLMMLIVIGYYCYKFFFFYYICQFYYWFY